MPPSGENASEAVVPGPPYQPRIIRPVLGSQSLIVSESSSSLPEASSLPSCENAKAHTSSLWPSSGGGSDFSLMYQHRIVGPAAITSERPSAAKSSSAARSR